MARALLAHAPMRAINRSSLGMADAKPAKCTTSYDTLVCHSDRRTCNNDNNSTKDELEYLFAPFAVVDLKSLK